MGGDSAGSASTIEISKLAHDAVNDGDSPVESGEAKSENHIAQYRASLTRISWPQNADVLSLQGQLTMMVSTIYRREIFKQIIASLKGGSGEVKTGKASALPGNADAVKQLTQLVTKLDPQYREMSVLLAHRSWLDLVYEWSQSAASARGISDFLKDPERRFLGRETQYSSLLADGTSANDLSAHCFQPTALRIIQNGTIESRFSWSRDSWFLFCGSRFSVSLLDADGVASIKTSA